MATTRLPVEPVPPPQPPCGAVPLSSLRSGDHATVESRLMAEEECELLAAMGLADHCRLRVCRAGTRCIVQVAATRLGLSPALACRVLVHREAATGP